MKLPCQALVIGYSHDVLAGEFLNLGVVLFVPSAPFASARFVDSFTRLSAAFPGIDKVLVRRVCGAIRDGLIEEQTRLQTEIPFDLPKHIEGLVSSVIRPDDAGLRFSAPILGVTNNPERTLGELFERFVTSQMKAEKPALRNEDDVWQEFVTKRIRDTLIVKRMSPLKIETTHANYEFKHAWKNGAWNVLQPVSFDLVEPQKIREKAQNWVGRLITLKPWDRETSVSLLVAMPHAQERETASAARDGIAILQDELGGRVEVVKEADSDAVASRIRADITAHLGDPT